MALKIHNMVGPCFPDVEEVYNLSNKWSQNTGDNPPADAPAWLQHTTLLTAPGETAAASSDVAFQDYVGWYLYFQWSGFADAKRIGVIAGLRSTGTAAFILDARSVSASTYKLYLDSAGGGVAGVTTLNEGQTYRIVVMQDTTGTTPWVIKVWIDGSSEFDTTGTFAAGLTLTHFPSVAGGTHDGTARFANVALVSGSAEADIDPDYYVEIEGITPSGAGNYTEFAVQSSECEADDGVSTAWDDWAGGGSHDGDTTYNCGPNIGQETMTSAMTDPSGFRNSIIGVQGCVVSRFNAANKNVATRSHFRANATDVTTAAHGGS